MIVTKTIKSYPTMFDNTTIPFMKNWTENFSTIENVYQTEAGTDQIEIIRYNKLSVSASTTCTSEIMTLLEPFSMAESFILRMFTPNVGVAGGMQRDFTKAIIKYGSTNNKQSLKVPFFNVYKIKDTDRDKMLRPVEKAIEKNSSDGVETALIDCGIDWTAYENTYWMQNFGINALSEDIIYNIVTHGSNHNDQDLIGYLHDDFELSTNDAYTSIVASENKIKKNLCEGLVNTLINSDINWSSYSEKSWYDILPVEEDGTVFDLGHNLILVRTSDSDYLEYLTNEYDLTESDAAEIISIGWQVILNNASFGVAAAINGSGANLGRYAFESWAKGKGYRENRVRMRDYKCSLKSKSWDLAEGGGIWDVSFRLEEF